MARGNETPARSWKKMPERELLQAVLAHEPGAWAGFYARYQRLMISCIKKALHRYTAFYVEEDIEDILNNVCLNLVKDDFKKLRAYDPERGYKLSSWVGLISTNTALDALRRREPIHDTLDAESEDEPRHQFADPSVVDPRDQVEVHEQWAVLQQAVCELSESDRLFLELYYDREYEPDEIAREMGISINTVYSRKNKVREKLRRIVEASMRESA